MHPTRRPAASARSPRCLPPSPSSSRPAADRLRRRPPPRRPTPRPRSPGRRPRACPPRRPGSRSRSPSASATSRASSSRSSTSPSRPATTPTAGSTVTLQNKIDPDLITLLGQGAVDIGIGDGTSVIPAVSQGIPVVYTATIYGQFPSVVIAKADSGIKTAADLKGKKIGIPGKYGSSWIMLQALLAVREPHARRTSTSSSSRTSARRPRSSRATVDAATGFANNEPIQLKNAGIEHRRADGRHDVPLPGAGPRDRDRDARRQGGGARRRSPRRRCARWTTIAADPQKGLDATFALVPDLAQDPALQRQILDATIARGRTRGRTAPTGRSTATAGSSRSTS